MTTAHFEKFAELVGKDTALLAKLGLDKVNADATVAEASAAAFITNAVKEANALGLSLVFVEKFAELIGKDTALLAKLGLDKVNADAAVAEASAAAFITNAVKEAKALGLEFTEDEAQAFMAAEAKAHASGELSDTQLEAVAGGSSSVNTSRSNKKPKGSFMLDIGCCFVGSR